MATALTVALACGQPEPGEDEGGTETGEDPMCEVAPDRAITLEPGRRELEPVARVEDIPGLSDQPTARGRTLSSLFSHQGRVHLGYGDYDQNTGPITMVAWVPTEAAFEIHGEASTEEVQRFLAHGGELFTSNIDPRGHEHDGSVFRLETACGEWEAGMPIDGAVHTYALLEHDGRIWVGTGSVFGAPALVMSSGDGGRSWRPELAVESEPEQFARILDGAAVDEQLLFTGRRFSTDGTTNFAWRHQDGEWTPVEGVAGVSRVVPIAFAGQLLVLAFSGEVGKGAGFVGGYALDGDTLVAHAWFPPGFSPINWYVAPPDADVEPWLWVLGDLDGETTILATADLASWDTVVSLPALDRGEPRSIAYIDNALFLGSSVGDLHVIDEVFSPD